LSAGINVIIGPNASGKTTTARAITSVIWPEKAIAHTETEAEFCLGGKPWHAELYGRDAFYQLNGVPEKRPALPAVEALGERCNVGLHDLLRTEDKEIAQSILLEAAGNYNLDAAGQALGFDPNPRFGRSSRDDFGAAKNEVHRITRELDDLGSESARLGELDAALHYARAADERAGILAQAIEKRRSLEAYETTAASLKRFDARLAALAGTELAQLEERQRFFEARCASRDEAQRGIDNALEQIAACRLPKTGVAAADIASLKMRLEDLRRADAAVEQLQGAKAAAQAREQTALDALGRIGDTAAPDLPALNDLAAFVREWTEVGLDKVATQRWRDWLGNVAPAVDLDELRTAEVVLEQWLRTPGPVRLTVPPWLKWGMLVLAVLLAFGSAAIALSVSPFAWLGLLPAAALLIMAFVRPAERPEPLPPTLPGRVSPPRQWECSSVQRRLDEIRIDLHRANLAAERQRERAAVEPAWNEILERKGRLEAKRRELSETLGCEIDPALFLLFIENVRIFRDARRTSAEVQAQLGTATAGRTEVLAAISSALSSFAIDASTDFSQAHGRIEDLVSRDQKWRGAHQEKDAREREHRNFGQQCDSLREEILTILTRANVADAAALDLLLRNFEGFAKAREEERTLRGLRENAEAFFRQHSEFEKRAVADLEREHEATVDKAKTIEELVAEKTGIETKIGEAKRRTALENAVAKREAAKRALLEERDSKLNALSGHLVLEDLRRKMGELSMPAVFEQARNLFARFTNHTWELIQPDHDHNFRARDSAAGGSSRPLAALSSGTRVQLLLALRAASVANDERGFDIKLPLLLDETLANSDDRRAQDIIAAIAELARDGRQIFYFTAQADEVAKWRAFFVREDVPHGIFDLSIARGEAAVSDFEHVSSPSALVVPSPDGLSYDEYGALLGAPPLDPREEVGAVHLWHVCEDAATLHGLLKLGLERWGQFEDALRHGGEKRFGDTAARLRANAQVIEELCACWRHGRGRPLVREALTEAGISGVFIDRVWEIARSLECDAAKLMQTLDRGEVSRLRSETREQLRQFCVEHGYISTDAPLSSEAIRYRLRSVASDLGLGADRADFILAKISV